MAVNRAIDDYEKSIQKDKPFPAFLGGFVAGSFQFVVATNPTLAYVRYPDGFQTTAKHRNRVDLTLDPTDPDNQDNPIALYFDEYDELAIWGPDPDQGGALLQRDPNAGAGGVKRVIAGNGISVDNTDPARPIVNTTGAAGAIGLVRTTTVITGDTSEHSLIESSSLSGARDIPANWLREDRQVRGRFDVDTTGAAGFTLTFKFYVGGVAVVTSIVTPTADGALTVEFRIGNVLGFGTIDYVAWMDVFCPDVSGALVHTLVHDNGTGLDVSGSPVPLDVTLTLGDASTSVDSSRGSSFEFIEVATLT